MAYDPNKQNDERENPYDDVVGGAIGKASGTAGHQMATTGQAQPALIGGAAEAGPVQLNAGGASAGGHVNFDQIYNANSGTSDREAKRMQSSAQAQGGAVKTGLAGVQQDFAGKARTGAMGGPTQAQADWAKKGATGVVTPDAVTGKSGTTAAPPTGQPSEGGSGHYETKYGLNEAKTAVLPTTSWNDVAQGSTKGPSEGQSGYYDAQGNWTVIPGGGAPGPKQGSSGYYDAKGEWIEADVTKLPTAPPVDTATQAAVEAGTKQKYTGPGSLSELDGYGQVLKDAGAVQDEANAFGMGNAGLQGRGLNQLDAALVGASGRRGFEDFSRDFGSIKSDVLGANAASVGAASAQKKKVADDAKAYEDLLAEFDARQGADEAAAGVVQSKNDSVRAASAKSNADKAAYDEYRNGSGLDDFRNTAHDIGRAVSLSEGIGDAVGTQGLVQRGTNYFSPMSSDNKGNVSDVWGDDDADVFASMTDGDWAEFAGLTDAQKAAWIAERKKKIREGG